MSRLALFCFSLILIGTIKANEYDNGNTICKNIPKLINFQTKCIVKYHNHLYHLEEYRLGNRGKLVFFNKDRKEEIFYENFDGETKVIYHNESLNACKYETINHKKSEDDLLSPPYKFFDARTGVFGPTGLLSLIENRLHKFIFEKKLVNDRGIPTHVCKGDLNFDETASSIVRIHISDPAWSFPYVKNKNDPQVLLVNIIADDEVDDPEIRFELQVEYLFFKTFEKEGELEEHETDFIKNRWVVPSICKPTSIVVPKTNIPNKFKMTLTKTNQLNHRKEATYEIVVDKTNDLYRFEKVQSSKYASNEIKVFRNNEKFLLDYKNGECIYDYESRRLSDEDNEIKRIILMLFMLKENKFHFAGQRRVRNIMTNVYRYFVENLNIKEVSDIYVEKKPSDLNYDILDTHDPIQLIKNVFEKRAGIYDLIESSSFQFYDFEILKDDQREIEVFKIPECEGQSDVELNLVAKNVISEPKITQKDAERLQKELRNLLIEKLKNEKAINFPEISFRIDPKELISKIRYRDYVSPILYVEKVSWDDVSFGERKESDRIYDDKESPEQCALESLKADDSSGFQFCTEINMNTYCHVIIMPENYEPRYDDLIVFEKDKNKCNVYKKTYLLDKRFFNFVPFDEKLKNLGKMSKAGDLLLKYLDHHLIFNKMHVINNENEIDRTKLYELKFKGQKFTPNSIRKTLKHEDGILNVATCYEQCLSMDNDFSCDSFAFCKRLDNNYNCFLGSLNSEKLNENDKSKVIEEDDNCNLYQISSLQHFLEYEHHKFIDENDSNEIIGVFDETKSSQCSQACLDYNKEAKDEKDRCLSIEMCEFEDENPVCRLSRRHALWEEDKSMKKSAECNIFSVKHILNFHKTSKRYLKNYFEKEVDSLDHCATICDQSSGCESFNYCERENVKKCQYVDRNQKGDKNTELESDLLGCASYVHSKKLLGSPRFDDVEIIEEVVEKNNGEGYKPVTVFGFLCLALFIGLLLGTLAVAGMTFRGRLKRERARKRKHRHSSQIHLDPNASQRNSTVTVTPIASPRNSTSRPTRASNSDSVDNRISVHYTAEEKDQTFKYSSWGLEMKEDSL